ncbi:Predicted PurR-regulated permease PerM [Streptosporangium subroseum]|uniref:Predicted PurR-regulated permease PerM n=1 Tax=Streptosporangium subroseum TaxID=106412 RepID=A0A239P4E5_9ACTN|nr:AI-2E family transporter [Streptosporangium subroseum]SNT62007.1 Predicted PurR-regulated permease PerM [Streptosporangium subroseum]
MPEPTSVDRPEVPATSPPTTGASSAGSGALTVDSSASGSTTPTGASSPPRPAASTGTPSPPRPATPADDLGAVPSAVEPLLSSAGPVLPLNAPSASEPTSKLPFGRPGRSMSGNPFVFGFTAALGVLTAWWLVQAVMSASSVLILIIVSLFLAIGLNPAVEALQKRRLPRLVAITIVFLGVILVFVAFGLAVVPPLTTQSTEFVDKLPQYVQELQNNPTIRDLDQRFQLLTKLQQYVTSGDFGTQMFGGVLGIGSVVIGAVFNSLTVLVLTLYFLGSLNSLKKLAYRLVPRSRRTRASLLGDQIIDSIGGYVAGNLIISLIAGVTTFFFLTFMKVPYALALALLVALTDLIPLVGAFIGAGVASLVGFFVSPTVGIVCLVFFTIYQQIENYWIAPSVMKSSVDVPPLATIVGALLGGALLGVLGALLGIPLVAAILLILREVVFPRQERA